MEQINSQISIENEEFKTDGAFVLGDKRTPLTYICLMAFTMAQDFIFFVFFVPILAVLAFPNIPELFFLQNILVPIIAVLMFELCLYILSFRFSTEGPSRYYSEAYIISEDKILKTTGGAYNHEVEKQFSLENLENSIFDKNKVSLFFEDDSLEFDAPGDIGITGVQDEIYNIQK